MIKSVNISGFQSHRKTHINLTKGLNCITGNSDTGKSAILRSLIWTITNKSSDKSFRTKGMSKSDIEICFSDGNEVSRVQDTSNCYYLVNPKTKTDLEFKAFKNLIPEDVALAINMDDLNISSQFDQPFLLSDSPGEVARKLNQVSGLSDIDTAIGNIRKQVLANSREISNTESILSDLQVQKDSFAYLSQMEKDVTTYEELMEKNSQVIRTISDLDSLTTRSKEIQDEIASLDSFLNVETSYNAIASMSLELQSVLETIRQLEMTVSSIIESEGDIQELNHFITAEKGMNEVFDIAIEQKTLDIEFLKLSNLVNAIMNGELKAAGLKLKLERNEIEFKTLMPNQCPLCGGNTK
jgi:DNA repair ATPase RecN